MKNGKKKQFDERRYKTAGTREGKEEQKTNTQIDLRDEDSWLSSVFLPFDFNLFSVYL